MKKTLYLVNTNATDGLVALEIIKKNNLQYLDIGSIDSIYKILKNNIDKGVTSFYICGGDGTVNNFINSYMKLDSQDRKKISMGVIPCGRANDLARLLDVPFDVEKALNHYKSSQDIKKVDIIKVNSKNFITGGGLGLPSEVIQALNNSKSKFKNKLLKDLVYYFQVLKKIVFGYSGGKVSKIDNKKINKQFMFLAIQNQDFIGKRFRLSPDSINDDGLAEMCMYQKPSNFIKDFLVVQSVINGNHIKNKGVIYDKFSSMSIKLAKKEQFMADGEILDTSDKYIIKVVPKAINIRF
jgi:diacylglycerol kinase (ATP)